jgi:hypothetical protein
MMRAALATVLILLTAGVAVAHPLSPALLELTEHPGGAVDVLWKTSLLKAPGTHVRPVLPADCPPTSRVTATEGTDNITNRWSIDCGEAGLVGRKIAVEDLAAARIDVLVRLQLADGRSMNFVLRAAEPSMTVPRRPHPFDVATGYARLGITHILGGPDHLLFVFGLILLVGSSLRMLAKTVTAFTIGHSITLSLAVLGLVTYPTRLIEALIALSVFVLAVELAREPTTEPTLMRRVPWMIAGCFGLLHGLGFAGALSAVGLPAREIPLALLSFNVGIEVGQLVFVVAVYASRAVLGPVVASMPTRLRQIPLYVMGSLAAFWCIQRVSVLL